MRSEEGFLFFGEVHLLILVLCHCCYLFLPLDLHIGNLLVCLFHCYFIFVLVVQVIFLLFEEAFATFIAVFIAVLGYVYLCLSDALADRFHLRCFTRLTALSVLVKKLRTSFFWQCEMVLASWPHTGTVEFQLISWQNSGSPSHLWHPSSPF